MRNIILLVLLIISTSASKSYKPIKKPAGLTYYVSPSGNDSRTAAEAQNIATPWKTLAKGWSVLTAGDLLYLRGGTYLMSGTQSFSNKSGASGNLIKVWAYPSEIPVFDWGNVAPGSQVRCFNFTNVDWTHWKGIRITGCPQSPSQNSYNYGWSMNSGDDNNIIEGLEVDHIGGSGIQVGANCNLNYILNCDSHHNQDPYSPNGAYENTNGFELALNVAGNSTTIEGCRAWWNADDGFDGFNGTGSLIFKNCWSFWNGYIPGTFTTAGNGQGFKCGQTPTLFTSVKRTFTNCLAFANRQMGFDQNFADNSHTFQCVLYNNTAYGNGNVGFYFGSNAINQIKNNISYSNGGGAQPGAIGAQSIQSNNSWNGAVTVSNADFLSVSSTGMDGARGSDGSLPVLNFMRLATGSDLANAGTNVGLPFNGTAPDMGAFESGLTANQSPTVNGGADKVITLPINTVQINATAVDPDGTIASYLWTNISGPNTPTLVNSTTHIVTVNGLIEGSYVVRLTVTDNLGATDTDDVGITVNPVVPPPPPDNIPPVSNAGNDTTIVLPDNIVTLNGSGSDADGTVASYAWTKVSGPVTYTIVDPTNNVTDVTGLVLGHYRFQLEVTDNDGATTDDSVVVIVDPVVGTYIKAKKPFIFKNKEL